MMNRSRARSSPQLLTPSDSVLHDACFIQAPRPQRNVPQPTTQREAELRRCNTELRRGHPPKEKLPPPPPPPSDLASAIDEIGKLRRQLSATMTARRSMEKMFSSLGKEKQMIATELARKVHELSGMEELVGDVGARNETLTEKVKEQVRVRNEMAAELAVGLESIRGLQERLGEKKGQLGMEEELQKVESILLGFQRKFFVHC